MIGFEKFIELLNEYTDQFSVSGIIRLVIDAILALSILFVLYRLIRVKINNRKLYLLILLGLVVYAIIHVFQFTIALNLLNFLLFWSFGLIILVYGQDIKHVLGNAFQPTTGENTFATEQEKQEVIDILIKTSVFLSKRRIGALMTIEREDNLNSFIDKAIFIRGILSEELLTTLFTVGTATHDGAVIIRKNRIMCAGAYLPSTDRYDVPKALGTRHRAAIGISERYDALTIVVSEETGNISLTVDGAIEIALSEEKLRETLEQYLIVK